MRNLTKQKTVSSCQTLGAIYDDIQHSEISVSELLYDKLVDLLHLDIMRPFIVFGIYILVPFMTSFLYKRLRFKGFVFLTHLLTAVLIFIYPYFIVCYDNWVNPPDPEEHRCGMPILGLYIGNTIFMIPITQGLLFLFNKHFKNYKHDTTTIAEQENKNGT